MPLKVIIAGAGLGGLGAAIAMARAGHNVEVKFYSLHRQSPLEADRSRFSSNQDSLTRSVPRFTLPPTQPGYSSPGISISLSCKPSYAMPSRYMTIQGSSYSFPWYVVTRLPTYVYANSWMLIKKLEELQKSIGTKDEWLLTHRVDLHSTLRKAATGKTFAGTIKIHTASKVVQAVCTCIWALYANLN